MGGNSLLSRITESDLTKTIREAGIAGAGGAGFPSYVKWENISQCDYLLINHQESEPICYTDKWLAREYADDLREFVTALLDTTFDVIVVGTKEKYRERWVQPLESTMDTQIYQTDDLPAAIEQESGIVFVYTPDVYTFSEESVLLRVAAGVHIGEDLPTDHGWIVHNTETIYNIYRAVQEKRPVTRKFVHVGGNTPRHRCFEVPIGAPATELLESAGVEEGQISNNQILADGGPGWCYEIKNAADEFGIRKRTNAVLVLDETIAEENTEEDGQIDVLNSRNWTGREHEKEPTSLIPSSVRIPLMTNTAYEGFVKASVPTVNVGDYVTEGDEIASSSPEGISNPQHASIDGIVTEITDSHIVIDGQ